MTCSQCNSTGISIPSVTTFRDGQTVRAYEPEHAYTCKLCDGTADQKRQWPFSCGTEAMDWKDRNCDSCLKGYDDQARSWRCDIEEALDEGAIGNGTVPIDIYRRMGIDLRNGRCTEYLENP